MELDLDNCLPIGYFCIISAGAREDLTTFAGRIHLLEPDAGQAL